MWITTESGFYSIVQDRDHPERLRVRSRSKADIAHFLAVVSRIEDEPVAAPEFSDYPWWTWSDWQEVSSFTTTALERIDYDNFKNRVAVQNPARAKTYMGVWSALLDIESEVEAEAAQKYDRFGSWGYPQSPPDLPDRLRDDWVMADDDHDLLPNRWNAV